eukprot:GHVL01040808.1.p1 GENE.GHVL01040808.1~~GHVL01040808.1.p1  ORF type:complete len:145 (-),score=35.74 GHVL01040808.1:77-511(-)
MDSKQSLQETLEQSVNSLEATTQELKKAKITIARLEASETSAMSQRDKIKNERYKSWHQSEQQYTTPGGAQSEAQSDTIMFSSRFSTPLGRSSARETVTPNQRRSGSLAHLLQNLDKSSIIGRTNKEIGMSLLCILILYIYIYI